MKAICMYLFPVNLSSEAGLGTLHMLKGSLPRLWPSSQTAETAEAANKTRQRKQHDIRQGDTYTLEDWKGQAVYVAISSCDQFIAGQPRG